MNNWHRIALSEYEDYVFTNYAGFRLTVRHIHGRYSWDAKMPGNGGRSRQSYWGHEDTLENAQQAAQNAALRAPGRF